MTPTRQPSHSVPFTDLSTFQVTVLAMLAREGPQYGLALRDDLEANTNMKIYGGKLYPNLDQLAEQDFIEKRTLDRRTNEYTLTDKGERVLHSFHTWLSDCGRHAGDCPQQPARRTERRERNPA